MAAFKPRNWEEEQVVRRAIRWHLLLIDGRVIEDMAWEHGWSQDEKMKIDKILDDRRALKTIVLAWRNGVGKHSELFAVVKSMLSRRYFSEP